MSPIIILTTVTAVLMGVTVVAGFGALMWRGGKATTEIHVKLDTITSHLVRLNGNVEEVTKRALENTEKITHMEGRHDPLP